MFGAVMYAEVGYAEYLPLIGGIIPEPNDLGDAIILTTSEEIVITLDNDDGAIILG